MLKRELTVVVLAGTGFASSPVRLPVFSVFLSIIIARKPINIDSMITPSLKRELDHNNTERMRPVPKMPDPIPIKTAYFPIVSPFFGYNRTRPWSTTVKAAITKAIPTPYSAQSPSFILFPSYWPIILNYPRKTNFYKEMR